MRKWRIAVLSICFLLLCGCSRSSKGMQSCLDFRTRMLKSEKICFSAAVTADYDTELVKFSMDCVSIPEEGTSIRMTEPETLAGICAEVDETDMQLVFDDVQVALPPLADDTLAPLLAGEILCSCWKNGDILYCEEQSGSIRMTAELLLSSRTLRVDTWLDQRSGTPQRAQIASEDSVLLTVELTDFQL